MSENRLDETSVDRDPIAQLRAWLDDAIRPGSGTPRRWRSRPRHSGRAPVGTVRPPAGSRRARPRLLHELREPQGARARGQSERRARALLGRSRPSGPRHRRDLPRQPRGVRGLLQRPPARKPARCLGLSAEPSRSARGTSSSRSRRGREAVRRRRPAACRRSGAATGSLPRRSSSGSTARAASTTGFSTPADPRAAGGSSASRRKEPAGSEEQILQLQRQRHVAVDLDLPGHERRHRVLLAVRRACRNSPLSSG